MIETVLVCLPNAVGSAFYSVGPLPHLSLKLVGSARRYGQADKDVPYGIVVAVMGELRESGIEKLGMVTEPKARMR